jgi:hypothetical protein
MEYNRTVVDDFITLHEVAQSSERLGDILVRLSAGSHRFRPRAVRRRVKILGQLLNQCVSQDEEQLYDELITRLEMYIESGLHVEFMDGVDEILNATDCDLPKDHPRLIGGTFQLQVTCRRAEAHCQLPALIEAHRAEIERVSEHLRGHPDGELRRLAQVAAQVLPTPGKAQGQMNCWRLSDLIIALEVPPDAAIYTTNVRHFAPLCEILGKRLLEERVSHG